MSIPIQPPTRDKTADDLDPHLTDWFAKAAAKGFWRSGRNLRRLGDTLHVNALERNKPLYDQIERDKEAERKAAEDEEAARRAAEEAEAKRIADEEAAIQAAIDAQTRRRLARKEFLRLEAIDRGLEERRRDEVRREDAYSAAREADELAERNRVAWLTSQRRHREEMMATLAKEEEDMHARAKAMAQQAIEEELARIAKAEEEKRLAFEEAQREWQRSVLRKRERRERDLMAAAEAASREYERQVAAALEREERNRRLDAERTKIARERREAEAAAKRREEERLARLEAARQAQLEEEERQRDAKFAAIRATYAPIVSDYLERHGRAADAPVECSIGTADDDSVMDLEVGGEQRSRGATPSEHL